MQVIEHGEWSRWKIPAARTARVVSQNVGPLGLRHVIPIIQKMTMTQRPSALFLQDCKLKETDANSIANLRQAFPQYNIFIRSGNRQETRRMHLKKGAPRYYCYSVVTLVHKGCGRVSEYQPEVFTNTPHRGRVLTVRIEPEDQLPFLATNVYNYTSRETDSQRELLGMLAARMDAGEIRSIF